jgi:hypothetical protein
MRVMLVHPSALMYSEIFLRLEPLGLERVVAALLAAAPDRALAEVPGAVTTEGLGRPPRSTEPGNCTCTSLRAAVACQ